MLTLINTKIQGIALLHFYFATYSEKWRQLSTHSCGECVSVYFLGPGRLNYLQYSVHLRSAPDCLMVLPVVPSQ